MSKNRSTRKNYLVLDIGTSAIKCGCVGPDGTLSAHDQRRFPMRQDGSRFEIDFNSFFKITRELLENCVSECRATGRGVEALLVTSQAQTFALVDAAFRPLRPGIVWLDERARQEAAFLKEQLPDFAVAAGFRQPLPSQYVSKLLWLKRHEPAVFERARAFPLIHEYVAARLTGAFYTDSTSFGMGGLYDFRRKGLNSKILRILGLSEAHFPEIKFAAEKGALISEEFQKEWKVDDRFPVFLCGNDQGASACGAGVKEPGDVAINLGTALVFYTVTETLAARLEENQIAGKHPVGDAYFLLSFEPDFGLQMRRLKETFFLQGSYDELFQTYFQHPETPADGAFSEKSGWQALSGTQARRACAGAIKFYVERFRENMSQIQRAVPVNRIFLSGGMLRSEVLVKIVQDVLQRPFVVRNRADAGLLGAVEIHLQNKAQT